VGEFLRFGGRSGDSINIRMEGCVVVKVDEVGFVELGLVVLVVLVVVVVGVVVVVVFVRFFVGVVRRVVMGVVDLVLIEVGISVVVA
jgi:hypothetical protein